jgi:hypothetical protein
LVDRSKSGKARPVGINPVALEVGDAGAQRVDLRHHPCAEPGRHSQ